MPKVYCLCKSMRPTLVICRMFGLLPITWTHQSSQCHFKVSKLWMLYSLVFASVNIVHINKIIRQILAPFQQDRELLLSYIASVNENVISGLLLVLIFINMYRAKSIAAVFNKFVELSNEDLLCQPTLKMYFHVHCIFAVVMFFQYVIQFSAIILFNYMDSFGSDWTYDRLCMPLIHNSSFLFHSIFGSTCILSACILICYETKVTSVLQFTSVHPTPNFCSNAIYSAFCWKYETCKDKHVKFPPMSTNSAKLEYLHSLFMRIQDSLTMINLAFNPQILLHVTSELIVMVLHWYAVIIYFTFDKVAPADNTNNFFHWYYVFAHSWAIYTSMNMAQQIETKIARFKCILLEYSTEITSVDEYQQIRLFVQQLHNYKGFSASGIFTVNLQIIAPICANILMYVLVAIQFKVPNKPK